MPQILLEGKKTRNTASLDQPEGREQRMGAKLVEARECLEFCEQPADKKQLKCCRQFQFIWFSEERRRNDISALWQRGDESFPCRDRVSLERAGSSPCSPTRRLGP